MRMAIVALVTLLAAGMVAAIDTEFVPYEQIKGEHWDFQFQFRLPQRVVMTGPDGEEAAYWALLYTVTNPDKVAHEFVPQAVMFTDVGKVVPDGLYPAVLEKLRERYNLRELANSVAMMGELKAGEDEARDGVFIFPEADPGMDRFKIFVTGLSGEFVVRVIPATSEGEEPREIALRKTMQLVFDFPGDEVDLDADKVYLVEQKWIWR